MAENEADDDILPLDMLDADIDWENSAFASKIRRIEKGLKLTSWEGTYFSSSVQINYCDDLLQKVIMFEIFYISRHENILSHVSK